MAAADLAAFPIRVVYLKPAHEAEYGSSLYLTVPRWWPDRRWRGMVGTTELV